MSYWVYILISDHKSKFVTYVGYTKNIKKRLEQHNTSKGAKFTKGRIWNLIYKKSYKDKSIAMKNEYKLKKDNFKRNQIKDKYIKSIYENSNSTSL
ncbi:GIY-YIG nuclease family protein [Candidatus Pelagibacter sp.]|nr:GIY-YIG nuclease family protein [Candidatus Pelagibacter sp.]